MKLDGGFVKLIYSSAFDKTVGTGVRIVEDPSALTKSAETIFDCEYDAIKPDKDHIGIHAVALGDAEHYGFNRNADGFSKKACIGYHHTFVKNGNVYRHHQNKDPEKRIGQIVKSAYNAPMGRIELFLHLNKDKARDELQKLATDGELTGSMACVLDPNYPVLTTSGYKAIGDIKVGEIVFTHAKKWQRVKLINRRKYTGLAYTFHLNGLSVPLELTADHMMWAKTFGGKDVVNKAKRYFKDSTAFEKVQADWMHVRHLHIGDRFFYSPIIPIPGVGVIDSTDLAQKYVGAGCKNKTICPEMYAANEDVKLAFLGAWLDGDGFIDKKGAHWSSANLGLGLQGRDLLATIDIPSSLYRIDHAKCATSGKPNSGMEYTLNIAHRDMVELVPWSAKVANSEYTFVQKKRHNPASMRKCSDGLYAYRISAIESRNVKDIQTYNLEVENDESYTLAGLISHNCRVSSDRCSICGNLRKSAHDPKQCEHVKFDLGKMAEDGKIVGTYNDEPHFFDYSIVTRPADRIAYSLKIAADEVVDSAKLAEAEGIWVPDNIAIQSKDALKKLEYLKKAAELETLYCKLATQSAQDNRERYLKELYKAAEGRLDDNTISKLREYAPKDVFYKLAKLGIILDVNSFFKYAMGIDYGELAPHMAEARVAVKNIYTNVLKENECQNLCNENSFDVATDSYSSTSGLNELNKQADDCSFIENVDQRIIEQTLNQKKIKIQLDKSAEIVFNTNNIKNKLAEKYAAYKLSAIKAIEDLRKDTDTEALLALAVMQNVIS